MKLILVLAAVFGLTIAAPQFKPRNLDDELQKFVDLIPLEDIKAVIEEHVQSDGAAVAVLLYLQGPEWAELVNTVGADPEVQDFIQYLTDAGLPVDVLLDALSSYIASLVPGTEPDDAGTLESLLADVLPLIPIQELLTLLNDELQNSPEIQELYRRISSEEAHALVERVRQLEEVQRLATRLTELGIPVHEILVIVYDFLGWGAPKAAFKPRNLDDELQKFVDLIPLEDIKAVIEEHVQSDGAAVAVLLYLQGPEWAELVNTVGADPEVQDFIQYLTDAGLPVDVLLDGLSNYIASLVPGTEPDDAGTLESLLADVLPLIPIQELLTLLNDELQNSPEIQELYRRISSEEAHALVERVRQLEEVQRLATRLTELGIPVHEILVIVYDFLGWGAPKAAFKPRNLDDELQKFVDLIPLEDIKAVIEEHVQSDGAAVAVLLYLQGPEWAELVNTVGADPEVQDFIQYLTDAGLPVDVLLDGLSNYIASLVPGTEPDDAGTLESLLADVLPLIPIQELLTLLNDELQNSPEIQELYRRISSEEAHALVERVRQLEEVQRLATRLTELGIPVHEILVIVYDFLGWGAPKAAFKPRNLDDELQKFVDLIPLEDIKAVIEEHVQSDGAAVAVLLYLQGPEWAELVNTVGADPEVQDFIQYLTDAGLPVDVLLDGLSNYIASLVPGTEPDDAGTLESLLADVLPLIPIQELLTLLNDELQNSPEIQELYRRISSEEAHALVERVRQLEEVQRLATRLTELGIPVHEILVIVYDFLGWGAP